MNTISQNVIFWETEKNGVLTNVITDFRMLNLNNGRHYLAQAQLLKLRKLNKALSHTPK